LYEDQLVIQRIVLFVCFPRLALYQTPKLGDVNDICSITFLGVVGRWWSIIYSCITTNLSCF
jgi:hypothetical protein